MQTSYFGNINKIETPLSISRNPPKWYTGTELKLLAPPWSLIKKAHLGASEEVYAAEYKRLVLDHLDPLEVYKSIVSKLGENVTLLCFETLQKPGEYCHRRMVANWFETNLSIEVPEWQPPPRKTTIIW